MWHDVAGLLVGVGMAGGAALSSGQGLARSYRRPRCGRWAGVAAGVGIAGSGAAGLAHGPDAAFVAAFALLGLGLVLYVAAGPYTRFGRRARAARAARRWRPRA
ncbi:hypothetical protein SAMN05216223_117116 [Actinacidiphila yanglinensis]|uniref:Uncharacterized protein n=2 Tax=Actinacidiphila yanglinensis TaxID=310779 RepID=A0A1H6DMU0_9ACTN|nr:hypothetical protein SAMN05216223_117116 [Actinacidiphila yanglinensis]